VVYNTRQFWDGRVTYLEEVVQAHLEDERAADDPDSFRHAWSGVVGRLRKSPSYSKQFQQVFGTAPTQDAVGQAIATYLRTILAGNSIHDRALRAQAKAGTRALSNIHYAAVLDDAALKELGRAADARAVVAADLLRGYTLFRGKASCAACHTTSNGHYSDNAFHNVGAGVEELTREPSRLGRF